MHVCMSMALKQGLILMQQQACLLDLFMPQFQMRYVCSNSFAFTNFRTRRILHNLIARIRKQRQPRLQPLPRRPLIEHVSLPNLD